jgi:GNAT superfamily N-acetyltransferase
VILELIFVFIQKTGIPLASSQLKPAAMVMARAFYEDPFFTFVLPDDLKRAHILPWLFKKTIVYGQCYGRVYTTPSLDGIALWLTPGNTTFTLARALRTGLALYPFLLSWSELRRSNQLTTLADDLHKRLIKKKHWYLSELGVEPGRQGSGAGTALLQPVLLQADRDGTPCYLETNKEVNLQFYDRSGFKVAGHDQLHPAGPRVWGMLRQPA